MTANKRTKTQIQRDRAEVARLYWHGWTQAEIGDKLNLSQQQISYDLKQIRKGWRESSETDIGEYIVQQLARIDDLEREAFVAWKKSLEDRDDEQGLGNAAWWDRMLQCVQTRNKQLGIDVVKVAQTDPTGQNEAAYISDDAKAERVAALLTAIIERKAADEACAS